MGKRIDWIDIAKSIGIFLVIFGHVGNMGIFNRFLYVFHMPLFFIMSGFFAPEDKSKWDKFFIKNTKLLLIPYLFLYIIGAPTGIISVLRHPELYPTIQTTDLYWKPILGLILGCENCFPNEHIIMANGPLWFLLTIFQIRLFYQLSLRIPSKFHLFISSCISLIIYFIIKDYSFSNIWHMKTALLCYPFFVIGYVLNSFYNLSSVLYQIPIKSRIIACLFCFILIYLALPYTGEQIRYVGPEYHCNILLAFSLAIIGSIGTFCIASIIPPFKFLIQIGKESLIIMGIHLTVMSFLKIILLLIGFPALDYTFNISFFESILTLILSSLVAKVLIYYIPSFVGYQKK